MRTFGWAIRPRTPQAVSSRILRRAYALPGVANSSDYYGRALLT
jgi:hypothetical protein